MYWVYRKTDALIWTVGYFVGKDWYGIKDYDKEAYARHLCHYLNGGN